MDAVIRFMAPPSATLGVYTGRLYLWRFLGLLLGLVAILQVLDVMAETEAIMAADGATWESIARYAKLRIPQLINQFTPFCALLATLLALAGLNQHSEIIVMKAAGLSAHRILLPLGLASALIAIAHFSFNELIVTRATAELDYWRDNGYALDLPPPQRDFNSWIIEDNTLVSAEAIRRRGDEFFLDGVSLFTRDADGKVRELVKAEFALHLNGQWTLWEVRRFDVASHSLTVEDQAPWRTSIQPDRFVDLAVVPERVNVVELNEAIGRLKAEGQAVDKQRLYFWQKFAGPASTLLMPILGAVAGFGVHRAGRLVIRVVVGMALGFAFFIADNFMLAMGEFGVAPPMLAAWAPFLLFGSIGLAVIFYTEE